MKQLFWLSKYFTEGVLQIPSDGDDPWKLTSTPKKNEYFEYLNKVSAKKRFVSKKSQNGKFQIKKKKKRYFDHSRDLEKLARVPPPHPSQVKIVSSPMSRLTILIVRGLYSLPILKNLKNAYSLRPTDSTL